MATLTTAFALIRQHARDAALLRCFTLPRLPGSETEGEQNRDGGMVAAARRRSGVVWHYAATLTAIDTPPLLAIFADAASDDTPFSRLHYTTITDLIYADA